MLDALEGTHGFTELLEGFAGRVSEENDRASVRSYE